MGIGALVIPTIYTAVDKMSRIQKGIARANQVIAKSADVAAGRLQRLYTAIGEKGMKKAADATAIGGAAILGTLALATNEAIKFEDRMSDIAKTTGLSGDALDQYGKDLRKLSTTTRTSIADLQTIGEIGGQLGVASNELLAFTAASDKFVIALGKDYSGGTEEAISSVGKIKALFEDTRKVPIADVITKAGSAINELGAVGAGTSSNINDFVLRLGALPDAIKPIFTDAAALGTFFEEVGIDSQIAAGGLSNFYLVAAKDIKGFAKQMGMGTKAAKNLFETDPTEFAKKFAASLNGMSAVKLAEKLSELGIGSQETIKVLGALGSATDRLTQLQGVSAAAFEKGTSLSDEAAKKNATTAAKLEMAKNNFQNLAITIGTQLLPVVAKFLDFIVPIITGISDWMGKHEGLANIIIASVAGFGSMLLLISGLIRTVMFIQKVTAAWTVIQKALNITMSLNPIGAIITGIALLIAAIVWVASETEGWGKQWDATMSWIKAVFKATWLELKMGFQAINIAFWDMVNAVVGAWYWAQNKMGYLSDQQYNKNLAQIAAEKNARITAFKETAKEYASEMAKVKAGPGWHVTWKDDRVAPENSGVALPSMLSTQQAGQSQLMKSIELKKAPVEITVKDQTAGGADITKNPMNLPILTKTFAKPNNR
ncbi:MAG: phage tail tape measure protein [Taibaiella sp.]|jgi:TP901 family phage tail tape measure protein